LYISKTNCIYTLGIQDQVYAVLTESFCGGPPSQINAGLYEPSDGLAGYPFMAAQPLPDFGEPLSGSVSYTYPAAGTFGLPVTVSISWQIKPFINSAPPQFTQLPTGGPSGCNPAGASIPNAISILDQVAATAASGQVSIEAEYVDVTNGCTVTRTFTFTATDDCSEAQTHAVVAYWWTVDTTPPVITSVPVGNYLGCNPASPPTDATVKGQVLAVDTCSAPTINVSHADTTSGCTVTRTFSITAADACGNVSPAKTVVYTWTADTTPPAFTQLPPGGYLGTNPPNVPDDAAARTGTQVSDNCGLASLTVTHTDGGSPPQHSRTFTIIATDQCGNTAPASATYTWTTTDTSIGPNNTPLLQIARSGTNAVLSWPTNTVTFVLIARSNLLTTTPWTLVTNVPAIVGGQFVVTNAMTAASRYYALVQSTGVPLLTGDRVGRNLVISWPTAAIGYTLKSTTNVSPGAAWSLVTNQSLVAGGRYFVTNTMTGPSCFYRLVK
jgi:hypothetical protein